MPIFYTDSSSFAVTQISSSLLVSGSQIILGSGSSIFTVSGSGTARLSFGEKPSGDNSIFVLDTTANGVIFEVREDKITRVSGSLQVTGSFNTTGSLNVIGPSTVTGSLVVSGSNGAGIFSQGATLVDYVGGIANSASYMVWRAPFSCSVVALYGYYVGGTSPQVNAFRSGSSGIGRLTGSNLILTAQNVWSASITTGLANTDFNVGDSLQVVISGSSNNQVAVQVDFIRKF